MPYITNIPRTADTATDTTEFAVSQGAAASDQKKITWATIKSVLATAFKHGGSNEIATATPAANVIPKAGAGGTLAAGFIPAATESAVGGAELATAAEIVTGTDTGRVPNVANLKTSLASDGMWLTKRTKMPDGATAVDSQDAWATTYSWGVLGDYSAPEVTTTPGAVRVTRTGTGYGGLSKAIAGLNGKTILVRYRQSSLTETYNLFGRHNTNANLIGVLTPSLTWAVAMFVIPLNADNSGLYFRSASGTSGTWFEVDWYWIGDYSYLTGTLSEEAARITDQLGDTAGVGVAASGYAQITNNLAANDTITVGGKVFTAKANVADLTAEGHFLIESTGTATHINFVRALLRSTPSSYDASYIPTPASPKYYAASAHPLVSAVNRTADNNYADITARNIGELGNSITLATSVPAKITLSGATLSGGYSDAAAKMSTAVANASQGLTAKTSVAAGDYLLELDSAGGFIKKKILASNFFAADGGTTAYKAVQGNDARLQSAPASWTPVPTFTSGVDDGTFAITLNNYTRSGKRVHLECRILWSAKGSKTGDFTMTGVPIAAISGSARCAGSATILAGGASITSPIMVLISNDTLYFVMQGAAGTSYLASGNFTNTTDLRFFVDYIAA